MSGRFGEGQRGNSHGKLADHSSPLRRVVERFHKHIGTTEDGIEVNVPRERLECGHVVRIKGDIFGKTNATRRRCKECAEGEEVTDNDLVFGNDWTPQRGN